jgi:hypothetical protein
MDHIAAARHAILDLGSEDYYHLADAAAYLPTVPEAERHAVAREAMLQLVEEGLVAIYFGTHALNEVTRVAEDQVSRVLNNPRSWDPLADVNGRSYSFANTDRGDAVYFNAQPRKP